MLTQPDEYRDRLVGFFESSIGKPMRWFEARDADGDCGDAHDRCQSLPLLGQGKKGLRIHDLVKAPANTPWAKAKQQSWDASEPATVTPRQKCWRTARPAVRSPSSCGPRMPLVVVVWLHLLRLFQ